MGDTPPHLVTAPLYRQVEEHLTRQIYDGGYAPGSQLPTDAKLQEIYRVSRITIRHALNNMARNNLIVRHRGLGTFVTGPDRSIKKTNLFGYLDEIFPVVNISLISATRTVPADSIASSLGLPDGKDCICFTGINYSGRKKMSYLRDFLSDDVSGIIKTEDYEGHTPVASLLETRSGIDHSHAEQTMGAVAAPVEIAEALGLDPGQPVMHMERAYYTSAGTVRYVNEAYYHPERYQFMVKIIRRSNSGPRKISDDMEE